MVTKRIVREHQLRAWVGDEERLHRLVRLLENLIPDPDEEATEGWAENPLTGDIIQTRLFLPSRNPELVVTASERGSLTLRGEAEEVFNEMDRSALESLEMEVSADALARRDQVRIHFDRMKGVTVQSRGETSWVDEIHTSLTEELDRGKPWWAWMRGDALAYPIGILVAVEFGAISQSLDEESSSTVLMSLTFGVLAAMAAGFGLRRLLPGFEVVRPGESGKGARALAAIGAVLLAVAGIVATFIAA